MLCWLGLYVLICCVWFTVYVVGFWWDLVIKGLVCFVGIVRWDDTPVLLFWLLVLCCRFSGYVWCVYWFWGYSFAL